MALIKATGSVSASLDADFAAALKAVVGGVDAALLEAAQEVGFAARRSTAFEDYKGTERESSRSRRKWSRMAKNLRESIKVERSKFETGGYIVTARVPHAHLVERGHLIVTKDKNGIVRVRGHVPPHPFLGPSLDAVRSRLIARLRAMQGAANG